ncbi:LexA family transcriptional regulator [Marinobacterium stanieri]|uniref:LexA family transcriptional regulator n=1 Tax=Marinobacterium stanieri TaxID=49186 RepID=UPI0002558847|nr:helix-turn-helix transcriptional regulator [Marinobacterium stanieri]
MSGEKPNSEAVSELGAFNSELFSERLRLAIGSESINKFASKCGFSESLVRKYLSGSIPGFDKAAVMARAAGVSLEWLAGERGERGEVRPAEGNASESTLEDEFAMIPGYSIQVAAGTGTLPSNEKPSRKLAFRRKWLRFRGLNEQDLVLVFAKGDSMEPTISDNNTLMIDTSQRELSDGSIYVIRTDHHLIVKRVQQLWNKGILLLSDNKEYEKQIVEPNEADDLEVIGRVVWIGKDV